ncbi:MAG: glycosyltransferase family 2 protein [Verrucomicrobiae bacterium]|nr:glycosyltransferase family 2 protein [Verrucomicrobiae bacterium]
MTGERVAAVIPAREAERTIADVVRGALRHCGRVIVGDDASGDRTGDLARRAGARVIVMPRHMGKGAVLRRLFSEGWSLGATSVVALDADGQHEPDDIPRFLEAHAKEPGALVIGDRLAGGGQIPASRWEAQRMAGVFLRHATGCRLADTQCGFRLVPRAVEERCRTRAPGFAMETEFLIAAMAHGVPMVAVPIEARYAEGQTSQFRPRADFLSIASVIAACLLARAGLECVGARDPLERAARVAGAGWFRRPALALAPVLVPLVIGVAFCAPGRFPVFGQSRAGVAAFARDCGRSLLAAAMMGAGVRLHPLGKTLPKP